MLVDCINFVLSNGGVVKKTCFMVGKGGYRLLYYLFTGGDARYWHRYLFV